MKSPFCCVTLEEAYAAPVDGSAGVQQVVLEEVTEKKSWDRF